MRDPSKSTTADGKRVCFGLNKAAGEITLAISASDVSNSGEQKQIAPAAEDKARPNADVEALTILIGNLRLIVPGSDDTQ